MSVDRTQQGQVCICGSLCELLISNVCRLVGQAIADWPKLLHLYSRLKPGKTVFEWMQEYDVQSYNIDVRRFTSFGVIKVSSSI